VVVGREEIREDREQGGVKVDEHGPSFQHVSRITLVFIANSE